ncbi:MULTISPECIES: type VII secretion protein EccB [Nocardia]|uniref:type VII secretion protein EccB n=1 Tax=Nocardia TaxID=1817 RepID=UPI001893B63E|nr:MULTISPECIES: type VII secretion protein EccB [Nocardia]MBF6349349.1 type VII secretion protein EccB [Nocardia flavorosea]
MPSKPTTRWQISGYNFLVRRMEHALVRRDVRMLHDPMRSQVRAYVVGLVLAVVVLAGCGVLALLRPQDKVGDNKILIGKESGAVYVVLNDVVHPALNLASARLAAGEAPDAVIVKESEVGKKARGPLIGIPGAPGAIHFDSEGKGRQWTICDVLKNDGSADRTTSVLAGGLELGAKASAMEPGKALLVQGDNHTYLVYDNKRARVDMNDRPVTDALNITGATPRPVSEGLINSIPEVLPLIAPPIADPGGVPGYEIGGHRIGEVVQVGSSEDEYHVVLADGLQQVSPLTAEIIRNSNPQTSSNYTIDQVQRTHADVSSALQVQTYPATAPSVLDAMDRPVSCLSWQPIPEAGENTGTRAELQVITGVSLPLADQAKLVPLAQADGSGQNVDSTYIAPGTGAYVQTTGIEPDSRRKDSIFYIADTGVRFGIKNADAAKALGMPEKAEPAPWPIVGLLAAGPSLGREGALVAHDGVAPDQSPAAQPVSTGK